MSNKHGKKRLAREVQTITDGTYQASLNVLDMALDGEEWAEQIVKKAQENIAARIAARKRAAKEG